MTELSGSELGNPNSFIARTFHPLATSRGSANPALSPVGDSALFQDERGMQLNSAQEAPFAQ